MIYTAVFLLSSLGASCAFGMNDNDKECSSYTCLLSQLFTGKNQKPRAEMRDHLKKDKEVGEKPYSSLTDEQRSKVKAIEKKLEEERIAQETRQKEEACENKLFSLLMSLHDSYATIRSLAFLHRTETVYRGGLGKTRFLAVEQFMSEVEGNLSLAEREIRNNEAIVASNKTSLEVKERVASEEYARLCKILRPKNPIECEEYPIRHRSRLYRFSEKEKEYDEIGKLYAQARSADEKVKALQIISRDRQRLKDFRDQCGKSLGL